MANTTLTSVRQLMTLVDTSVSGILDDVNHLQRHLSDNGLITDDAQYFIDSIKKYATRVRDGVE